MPESREFEMFPEQIRRMLPIVLAAMVGMAVVGTLFMQFELNRRVTRLIDETEHTKFMLRELESSVERSTIRFGSIEKELDQLNTLMKTLSELASSQKRELQEFRTYLQSLEGKKND